MVVFYDFLVYLVDGINMFLMDSNVSSGSYSYGTYALCGFSVPILSVTSRGYSTGPSNGGNTGLELTPQGIKQHFGLNRLPAKVYGS